MTFDEAKQKLESAGQNHILKYFDTLDDDTKTSLLQQIEDTDFSVVSHINDTIESHGQVEPIKAMTLTEIEANTSEYRKLGLETIKQGKVAAVLLAGGMGTRLGSDNPKGMYDIGITKPVYIFQRLIENLLDVVKAADNEWIHLFVMTSDKNHEATTRFFKEQNNFGYDVEHIHFFKQDMAPATDYQGKIYLEEKGKIATSPNGNGGWLISLYNAGFDEIIHKEGIEWLNVFAVDNVLQRIADPCFVGATISSGSDVGAKVVRKNHPDEKVGVMCLKDKHPSIIEYYELTPELRDTKTADGDYAYNFGVILNYLFNVPSVERIMNQSLPLHIVEKKIPYIDDNGVLQKPTKPNGYKFESLILDLIQMMEKCLPYEVEREKEFAPIKNKTGVDSVESARKLLMKNGYAL